MPLSSEHSVHDRRDFLDQLQCGQRRPVTQRELHGVSVGGDRLDVTLHLGECHTGVLVETEGEVFREVHKRHHEDLVVGADNSAVAEGDAVQRRTRVRRVNHVRHVAQHRLGQFDRTCLGDDIQRDHLLRRQAPDTEFLLAVLKDELVLLHRVGDLLAGLAEEGLGGGRVEAATKCLLDGDSYTEQTPERSGEAVFNADHCRCRRGCCVVQC